MKAGVSRFITSPHSESPVSPTQLRCTEKPNVFSFLTLPVCRSEAAEVGSSARRLDPRPWRQDAAQEEDHVQQEEDGVRPSQDGKRDVWEQEEEEVDDEDAEDVGLKLRDTFGDHAFLVCLPDAVDSRTLSGLIVNREDADIKRCLQIQSGGWWRGATFSLFYFFVKSKTLLCWTFCCKSHLDHSISVRHV